MDDVRESNKVTTSKEELISVSGKKMLKEPYKVIDTFREIVVELYGPISTRLSYELAYNLEATCFFKNTMEWSSFRIRKDIDALLEKYGYKSIQEWDEYIYGNRLKTVYLTKAQVNEILEERIDEAIEMLLLEESKKIHPLFGMIIADNISRLMGISAYLSLREMDPDEVRDEARRLLKTEAAKQLRRNKYFSFQQWEDKLKTDFGA